jgi:hypothetical protein
MLCGLGLLAAPILLPLFFCSKNPRRALFYFVGVACTYLCYKVAQFLWVLLAFLLASIVTSLRHENSLQGIQNSFDLVVPGLKQGHMFLGLLPCLTLGTLLSVIALRKLKAALLKDRRPSGITPT